VLTIVLGALFLYGTGQEWHRFDLRTRADHLHEPFWNNVLLAGWPWHAFHVYRWINHAGHRAVLRTGRAASDRSSLLRVDVLSLYWHFVDGRVWVVVFTVVYVLGRWRKEENGNAGIREKKLSRGPGAPVENRSARINRVAPLFWLSASP